MTHKQINSNTFIHFYIHHYFPRARLILLPLIISLGLLIKPSYGETIDTVIVTGKGYDEETATSHCVESAVKRVMGKYVREAALAANKKQIQYRVLDRSSQYLRAYKVLSFTTNDDGTNEITAEFQVSVDKLLTSLRNLEVEVLMWAPGPDQAIEGRRGAGSKTKPDRFKEEH